MAFTIVRNDVNYYSPSTRCVAHLSLPSRPRIVRCHFLVALTYTFLLFSTINIHLQINGRLITVFTDMNESEYTGVNRAPFCARMAHASESDPGADVSTCLHVQQVHNMASDDDGIETATEEVHNMASDDKLR